MMMADEGFGLYGPGDDDVDDDGGDLSMDLDTFWHILGEDPEQPVQQSIPEELSVKCSTLGEPVPSGGKCENSQLQNGNSLMVSDCGNPQSSSQMWSPAHTYGKHNSWFPLQSCHEASCSKSAEASEVDIPSCSTSSSFAVHDGNYFSGFIDKKDTLFSYEESKIHSKYGSHSPVMGTLDVSFGNYGACSENSLENLGPENNSSISHDFSIMNADMSSQNATSTESKIYQSSDVHSEWSDQYSMEQFMDAYNELFADQSHQYIPNSLYPQVLPSNGGFMTEIKDEEDELPTGSACSSSKMMINAEGGRRGGHVLEASTVDYIDINGQNYSCEGGSYISPVSGNFYSNAEGRIMADRALPQPSTCVQSYMSRENQSVCVKDESSNDACFPLGVIDEAVRNLKQPVHDIHTSKSNQKLALNAFDKKENINLVPKRACHVEDVFHGIASKPFVDGRRHMGLNATVQGLPFSKSSTSHKQMFGSIKDEKDVKLINPKGMSYDRTKFSFESSSCRSIFDNDPDICIIEEFSQPARPNMPLVPVRSVVTSHCSTYDNIPHHTEVGSSRFRVNDERSIFRAALQDLSQPKSEASPPDGLLAVPLLRHQRIALSWMVNKETAGTHCSGGILADDQGLGKTISTIALLLKERPLASRASQADAKQGEPETLNLDEDDDEITEHYKVKDNGELYNPMSNGSTKGSKGAFVIKGGRPAAGTLVVCPTSVLRQWADELQNKVTGKADLTVLVYHGSSRTKDPCELAKYDVVLTTYSIVSMEVPKQPLADKDTDDDEKGNSEGDVDQPMGFSSKKRKYPPSSGKKCSNNKKGTNNALLESGCRPLAKVGWFRVVLDEAQSIKNHKTQVARACWGLRAKRRWCLSGTPIQNAVDDLYSYFRFLRYEPYSIYQEFCSKIKVPINKNSSKGYKKLQAVLKTIMLRRTKGTLLDGQPIIILPPKTVELKKVDFSKEERDFYTKLEADSRAQFEEYAAAGTVKQNYVNILLMLLRLRQACDHPLLVKGCDSNSVWKSSVESAMKFPQEKRSCLLRCLEDSLALCGICNDPPEDAVVTVCGHVFCNQCILEQLTGEDKQCPVTNCKDQLCVSSVFSRDTLNRSLSYQPCVDSSSSNCSELVETFQYCSEDSSKIRAALEVLRSLPKPGTGTSENNSRILSSDGALTSPQNPTNSFTAELSSDKKDLAVEKVTNGGEKAIVFSQWTKMLDLVEASLRSSSIQYRRLDGTMSVFARDKAVKDFNTLPEVSVMIMSLKAASLGLNMVAACHVLLLDLWWNPTTEDQAIDRAHRIGQTRPVKVLRLTVKDTVEDRILALQQKKREMVASAFGEDETGSKQTRLTVEDLKYLFTA